jgi:hypothetical protein
MAVGENGPRSKWVVFNQAQIEAARELSDPHASDRAVALIGAALVEDHVTEALIRSVRPEEGRGEDAAKAFRERGPLSSYGAKIEFGYLRSIWDRADLADLRLIGKIRNSFAHDLTPISFSSREVSRNGRLTVPDRYTFHAENEFSFVPATSKSRAMGRARFVLSCQLIMLFLVRRMGYIQRGSAEPGVATS